jgi:DNA-binding MarR family transcriptional regulator
MSFDRTGNLLGALSLTVADRTADAVAEAAGRSHTAAAALSWMHQFKQRPSVDFLRKVLGLTSSGTVRLIDRLEEDGYLERGPGPDGRTTSLALTAAGRRAAQEVAKARAEVLEHALSSLTEGERRTLEELHAKMLVSLMRNPDAVRWMCRICDVGACRRDHGCPVTNVVRERYGSPPPSDNPS